LQQKISLPQYDPISLFNSQDLIKIHIKQAVLPCPSLPACSILILQERTVEPGSGDSLASRLKEAAFQLPYTEGCQSA
jgi:hypothetical protein